MARRMRLPVRLCVPNPVLPAAAEFGIPALIISYRNNVGAPESPDGFYRYGQTEWQDLQGAVQYAIEHVAEQLILMGYSMGGAMILNFLYQSQLADKVVGIILDAPMLNFGATVESGALQLGVPLVFVAIGKFFSTLRFDINWEDLNYINRVDQLTLPLLLFHGDADTTVPIEISDSLATSRCDTAIPSLGRMSLSCSRDTKVFRKLNRDNCWRVIGKATSRLRGEPFSFSPSTRRKVTTASFWRRPSGLSGFSCRPGSALCVWTVSFIGCPASKNIRKKKGPCWSIPGFPAGTPWNSFTCWDFEDAPRRAHAS